MSDVNKAVAELRDKRAATLKKITDAMDRPNKDARVLRNLKNKVLNSIDDDRFRGKLYKQSVVQSMVMGEAEFADMYAELTARMRKTHVSKDTTQYAVRELNKRRVQFGI